MTRRAVLLGLALLVVLAPAVYYVEVVSGAGAPAGVPARLPVAALFVLGLLMGIPIFARSGLSRTELLVVYLIILIGAPLGHRAVIFYLLYKVPNYYYMARAFPDWEHTFIRLIPTWWSTTDPHAVNDIFRGQSRVPWGEWLLPLGLWWSVMVAFWGATICLLILIQRQWISHERLSFPVAQIPLDMIEQPSGARAGRLVAGRAFWIGFAVALFLAVPNSLRGYVPAVPAIPLHVMLLENPRGILQGVERFLWYMPPAELGLFYLVPKEITFSCWFFWVLRQFVTVGFNLAGMTGQTGPQQEALLPREYQGVGAAFGLLMFILWMGRQHLLRVFRVIVGTSPASWRDSAATYRGAGLGLIACSAWLMYFFTASGCRLGFALLFLGIAFGYYVMWARMRAESGLGTVTYPEEVYAILSHPFGSGWLRPREIVTMFTMRWATWLTADCTTTAVTGHVLEGLKVADSARINVSRVTWAMIAAFVVSLVVGSFVVLRGVYGRGYFETHAGAAPYWPALFMRTDGAAIHSLLRDPRSLSLNAVGAMGFGAVFVLALGLLRLQFWWWPFHPMGLLASYGADMGWLLFTWIVAWALKVLVIRFGGLLLYRRTVPLAVGFIVGDLLNGTFWMVVDLVVRG